MTSMVMRFIISFCTVMIIFSTAGCGFKPQYGTAFGQEAAVSSADLASVAISIIPDRNGVILRNALIDRFHAQGAGTALYRLDFTPLQETIRDLDITIEAEATRQQVRITGGFNLVDIRTGKSVLSRDVTAAKSYNVVGSQFATRVSEDAARQNVLDDIARQVENHVALFFNRAGEQSKQRL